MFNEDIITVRNLIRGGKIEPVICGNSLYLCDKESNLDYRISEVKRRKPFRIPSIIERLNPKAAGVCPVCGQPVKDSDNYCSKCGTHLDWEWE